MAIEGDLSDISLPTMAQMICIERRNFALSVHRGSEQGQVHFEKGEIVHAALGELQGTEAMYQLLTWSNGTFRITHENAPPAKTIDMHWNQLLLEGLRKIDERRRDEAFASPERGSGFESDLLSLLGALDQEVADLADLGLTRHSEAGLAALERIVNTVMDFAEEEAGSDLGDVSLLTALAAAGEKVPEARLLKVFDNRLSTLTLVNLIKSWGNDPIDRVRTMTQVCRACSLMLERFFTQFGKRLQDRPAAQRWSERSAIFLGHLHQVVARVDL